MYLSTAALLLGVLGTLWWMVFKPSRYHQLLAKIPGPTPVPVFGNALQFDSDIHEVFKQLVAYCEKYEKTSPVFKYMLGNKATVVVSTVSAAEQSLASTKNLTKGSAYDFLHPWLQDGLLTSQNGKWRLRRKQLTSTFHLKILTDFLEVFNEQSQVLIDLLEEKCGQGPLDVSAMVTMCALDIICETAMGTKMGAQQNGNNSEYVTAVNGMSELVVARTRRPWESIDFIYNLTSRGKRHRTYLNTLHSFTRTVIDKRLSEEKEVKNPNDSAQKKKSLAFLDLLVHMAKEENFTRNEIQEEVDTFMFAGYDTTAAALAWTLYEIGSHPDIQARLHQEVDEIFDDSMRPATMADISRMKYLECVLKESLRMYPPVSEIERLVEEEIDIDGVTIPRGVCLSFLLWKINRDPKYYMNPDIFDPDRFNSENSEGRHPLAFVPFSAGPRNCIGQKYALIEAKCVLSSILRNFSFESTQTYEETGPMAGLILRPMNGIIINLSKRV